MAELFTLLPSQVIIKWLMLLIPLFILIAWHHYQHRGFQAFSHNPSPLVFREMLRTARWRSVQVIAVWLFGVWLVVEADMRFYQERSGEEVQETAASQPESESAPKPVPALPASAPSATSSLSPEIENRLDELKFRYEDAFVSYLYLQHCQKADMTDLSAINEALAREVMVLGTNASSVQLDIFSAAQGSFESMYADTPCDATYLTPMLQQFQAFMTRIRKRG